MEDPAVYQTLAAAPADLRDLVTQVAAWLAGLHFEVVCGPLDAQVDEADVSGGWQSPSGAYFFLMLLARPGKARCEFSCSDGAARRDVRFAWREVRSLREVQWLVTQDERFKRVAAAAGLLRLPVVGAGESALPERAVPAPPGPAPAG